MPDNMNISTPISGNTNISRPDQMPKEPPQVKVVDPTRVTKPNTNKQADQNPSFEFLLNRTSVFSTFVSQLRQIPTLNETLQKMMFELFYRKDELDNARGVSALMKQLSSATEMEKADIVQNLLYQSHNQTRFSDPVFTVLRNMSRQYPNSDFDIHLSHFLKAYDGALSETYTMKELGRQLHFLVNQMPRFYSKQLQPLIDALLPENSEDNIRQNLQLMKEKIVPLLKEYAFKTKDIGKARDTITLFIHTLARLNIGSKEKLPDTIEDLMAYCRYELHMPADKLRAFQPLIENTLKDALNPPKNEFFDTLMQALSDGEIKMSQTLCKAVSNSLLMDQSVYMPFTHLFLPLQYHDQVMFSEIWIEKDQQNPHSSGQNARDSVPQPTQIFLSFEIKNLGYFEVFIKWGQAKTSVELHCPPTLQKSKGDIQESVSKIFAQNGLPAESITVSLDNTPQIPDRILRKVYEWRNVIDVSV